MTIHTVQKGDVAESVLMSELLIRNLSVSIPFGHNSLYDLVVEHGKTKKLLKVQVKMRKDNFYFRDMAKYVGNVDICALLCGDVWIFLTNTNLKKHLGEKEWIIIDLKRFRRNNWELFGCLK